jgi:anti-sigma regulatory factor (Ser/Thr protein kinase)
VNAAVGQHWSREFAPETRSVRAARRFVLDTPAAASVDAAVLELLLSEVASNAVLHARTTFAVTIFELDDGVRVEIEDGDTRLPHRSEPDPTRITGRGMHIVSSLAREWGAEPAPDGKIVWFELGAA